MLNNPRTRQTTNNYNDNKRNGFIGDDKTIHLISQALSDKQWVCRFTDLKNQLKVESAKMPSSIRINKAFATLRGLCLGPEVVMSLNAFERKYYEMENRVKFQEKSSHSRSVSSESTTSLIIKYVLDEKSSTELPGVVDIDQMFIPKNYEEVEVNETGYNTPHKHQSTYEHRVPHNDADYADRNDSSSPYSDSTVLDHRRHNRINLHLALPRSGSTHYFSPSALSSPTTPRLEAFSPMLSPVRENKTVEEIWRDESLYLAPLPCTPKEPGLRLPPSLPCTPTNKPVSRTPSPYQRRLPACFSGSPGAARQKRYTSLSHSSSSSILRPRGNIGQDKVLPPTPHAHSSPDLKRGGFLESLKVRKSSEPTTLIGDPKQSRVVRLRSSPRTPSIGTLPLSPTVTIRKNYPRIKITTDKTSEADRRSFESLGSRTPTPTGRIADNNMVQDRHRSMERGMRSSYISTKTSRTTASESSIKTVTQYCQSVVSTPSSNVTVTNKPKLPTHNSDFDPSPERSEQRNNRISITPSLLSSPGRRSSFRSGGEIYEDKKFRRENSAASTILSAATNSTGDIPNLMLGIFSDSSVRRVPGIPKLIEVTKNTYGGNCAVPLEGTGVKQSRIVSDASTMSTMYSMKSIDMIDEEDLEVRALITSEVEKKADPTIKRVSPYGSSPKIPNPKNSGRRITLYENDPRAKDSLRKGSKKFLGTTQRSSEGVKEGSESKNSSSHNTKAEEAPEALVSRPSPKPRTNIANQQKPVIGRPDGRQQRVSNTGAQNGGVGNSAPGLGRNQRISSAGNGISQKNAGVSGVERNYMRPLAKDKHRQNTYSPPARNRSSGNLSTLPKSSPHPGGQTTSNRRGEQAVLTDRRNSKSLESLRKQGIPQDATSKSKLPAATGNQSGSKVSLNSNNSKADARRELAKSTPPAVIESHNSPTNSKKSIKSSVLVDITGIGCGSNPRTIPIGSRNWFGRRSTGGTPTTSGQTDSSLTHLDAQKENARPYRSSNQQYPQPTTTRTPKSKSKSLGNLTSWLSRGSPKLSATEGRSFLKSAASRKAKGKSTFLPPNGQFSQDEVDNLIKRLSAQIPQTPDEKNGFNALGGRYYTLNIPSLDKSPSKDEKDRNPIAVCMDLINAASNEPQSPRRERLLQMSRVMVDAVSKSRDAECAAEEAKMAARRAEVAFLETRRHLVEMTELMKNRKQDI